MEPYCKPITTVSSQLAGDNQSSLAGAEAGRDSHHLDRHALNLIAELAAASGDADPRFILLKTKELARILRLTHATLEIWRCQGKGPQPTRQGRMVFYRLSDVLQWLEHCAQRHASCGKRKGRQPGSRVVNGKVVPPETAQ